MEPEKILQNLIRFNTTNPPGNEFQCIKYIEKLLKAADIKSKIYYKDPKRPNLYARITGRGNSSPLLFYGHVDVVTAENQKWQVPPFKGKITDGILWGRGALDMKGGIAVILSALLKAKFNKLKLPGDVICCFLSDEEENSAFGAEYIVKNHPDLFKDVKFAVSEFGGFSIYIAGKKFYPIQVAEKQICRLEIEFTGQSGHGALYMPDQAIKKLALFLRKINNERFPVHLSPVVKSMFKSIAEKFGFPLNIFFRLLINPLFTNLILKLLGQAGNVFQPLFRNILNAAIVEAGSKINVIPPKILLKCDGRIIPGIDSSQFIKEVEKIAGCHLNIKTIDYDSADNKINFGLFEKLKIILKEMDPEGSAIPFLLPGSTDARFFSQLGIQTYGFIPMNIPKEIQFFNTIHGADERVPVSALRSGAIALYKLLQIF